MTAPRDHPGGAELPLGPGHPCGRQGVQRGRLGTVAGRGRRGDGDKGPVFPFGNYGPWSGRPWPPGAVARGLTKNKRAWWAMARFWLFCVVTVVAVAVVGALLFYR